MRKRRNISRIVRPVLVAMMFAGCSGGQTFAPEGWESTAQPETVSPPTEPPAGNGSSDVTSGGADVVYLPIATPGWWGRFSGGMVGGATNLESSEPVIIWGWLPGMDEVSTCELTLLQDNEIPRPSRVEIAATTGVQPEAAILYAVTMLPSGLTPQASQLILQPIDLTTCSLGTRIPITSPIPDSSDVRFPNASFVGASERILAINLETPEPEAWRHHLIGADVFEGSISYSLDAEERVLPLFLGGLVLPYISVDSLIFDVENGEPICEMSFDPFDSSDRKLTEELALDRCLTNDNEWYSLSYSDRVLEVGTRVGYNGLGNAIIVSWQTPDNALTSAPTAHMADLVYGDINGIHTIIDSELAALLDLQLLGVNNGLIYLRNSTETFVIGLDGQQVGTAIDTSLYPYVPRAEQLIGGEIWTLWAPPNESLGAATVWDTDTSQYGWVITRNGIRPTAQTPA